MNDSKANGRKTKIRNQERQIKSVSNSQDKGENEGNSGRIEYKSERVTGEMGSGLGRTAIYRSLGGILGLLREIVNKGLNYMDAHSERLEERLTESKRAKADFLEQAAALEKEIVRLLEQAEKLPEDSNEKKE